MEKKEIVREGRTFWTGLVEEFERTEGLSQLQFARLHGVKCSTFRHWLYTLRKERRSEQGEMVPVRFVEITPRELPGTLPKPSAAIVELGGLRLILETLPDPAWLAELAFLSKGR